MILESAALSVSPFVSKKGRSGNGKERTHTAKRHTLCVKFGCEGVVVGKEIGSKEGFSVCGSFMWFSR
jgi:hypothetical protein